MRLYSAVHTFKFDLERAWPDAADTMASTVAITNTPQSEVLACSGRTQGLIIPTTELACDAWLANCIHAISSSLSFLESADQAGQLLLRTSVADDGPT